jgi:hypothetical protein
MPWFRSGLVVSCAVLALACWSQDAPVLSPSRPSPAQPSGLQISAQLTAEPENVPAGGELRYTLTIGQGLAEGLSPHAVVHLPPGVGDVRTSGSGWICRQIPDASDEHQSGPHLDVDCSSAILPMSGGMPPLGIRLRAPLSTGSIRACAMVEPKVMFGGPVSCTTSAVVP